MIGQKNYSILYFELTPLLTPPLGSKKKAIAESIAIRCYFVQFNSLWVNNLLNPFNKFMFALLQRKIYGKSLFTIRLFFLLNSV